MKQTILTIVSSAERAWKHAQAAVSRRGLISTSTKYRPAARDLQDSQSRVRFTTPTTIDVRSADMMTTAWQISAQEPNERVLLHNMCHATQRGGFPWTTGAMEEALFRATDISGRLTDSVYPIRTYETVVTSGVKRLPIYDGKTSDGVCVDVISAAALNLSNRVPGKRMSDPDAFIMRAKIECLLWTAWILGYTCLILSAWGCGGFGCPPEHIAELFCDALIGHNGTSPWRYAFRRVVFCIQDGDGRQSHSNYQVFRACVDDASLAAASSEVSEVPAASAVSASTAAATAFPTICMVNDLATTATTTGSNAATIDSLATATSHSEQLA
jgi:hypothetical protein